MNSSVIWAEPAKSFCPSCARTYGWPEALFPLPDVWSEQLSNFPRVGSCFDDRLKSAVTDFAVPCWCHLATLFTNHLHDKHWSFCVEPPTKGQLRLVEQIEKGVKRVLNEDCNLRWEDGDVAKELSKRNISYNGEEVSKPEMLEVEQVIPGLPPEGHGGRIPITKWIEGKCKWYLERPKECLLGEEVDPGVKLQAKVHAREEVRLPLSQLLVNRGICRWVREDKVLQHRGEKVLNGMFGVEKSKRFPSGKPVLRLIMNLIPSNSLHKCISGRVHQLPHITRWTSLVVEEGEVIHVCQSDMQVAFYLFSVPEEWSTHLCFNLCCKGEVLGFSEEDGNALFYLACRVLPMGWSSAVGVMQFVAEEVLYRNGMSKKGQIRKSNVLPSWMVETCQQAKLEQRSWWHVYLDNYASGEKVKEGKPQAGEWQSLVEGWWEQAGIVSSKDKSIRDSETATELGAYISGKGRWIGASSERLLKLAKTTLWVLRQERITRKIVQVLMGRWIFVLQFRRPGMAHFEAVWEYISEKRSGEAVLREVRTELLGAVMGSLLFHSFLGARVDEEITCSDASQVGGAVAVSRQLSDFGTEYLHSIEEKSKPKKVPVAALSLFNGIGACYRCYDLAGVEVVGGIASDIHAPGRRVTSRRWPWVVLIDDIRQLSKEKLEELFEEMDPHVEIHIWIGFPCVDLSSAKADRRNLSGDHSSLIFEAMRVLEAVKSLYPHKTVKFIIENVASMDVSARDAISDLVGVRPLRLDPSNQVPMGRPRFCWTNVAIPKTEELKMEDKGGYIELEVKGQWPQAEDWLEEGASQYDTSVVYPTCMKSIPRVRPPLRPAGIERCSDDAIARWQSHSFRFPPYQYKEQYLIWDDKLRSARLLSVSEREKLMGLGEGHTAACMSASKAKANKTAYTDERLSLIGDSFAVGSFMILAAAACFEFTQQLCVGKMNNRLGLPPGATSSVHVPCPLSRKPTYGAFCQTERTVEHMNAHLVRRANHTGSDVRITTGEVLNPRQLARQSVVSAWWQWNAVFRVKWQTPEHINPLECRAILLALLWKARKGTLHSRKVFHLTDSYVCQSILSKGRTSSKLMQPVVRRANSLLLASFAQLYLAHVDSADNPTDGDSRKGWSSEEES